VGWEALAAIIVGLLALGIVLEPLWRGAVTPRSTEPLDLEEAEATPRGQALSALGEIEFDRETGKLSEADYQQLHSRYAARAIEILKSEEQTRPKQGPDLEAMVAARVAALSSGSTPPAEAAASGPPQCSRCGPRPEPDAVFCSSCGRGVATAGCCSRCGARLRDDGRFCEACGTQVAA
jgi:hypothetical protein